MANIVKLDVEFIDKFESKKDLEMKIQVAKNELEEHRARLRELVFCTEPQKFVPSGVSVVEWLEDEIDMLIGQPGMIEFLAAEISDMEHLLEQWDKVHPEPIMDNPTSTTGSIGFKYSPINEQCNPIPSPELYYTPEYKYGPEGSKL